MAPALVDVGEDRGGVNSPIVPGRQENNRNEAEETLTHVSVVAASTPDFFSR